MTDPLSEIHTDCEYRRPAPTVDRTVSFRPVAVQRDLERLHAWFGADHVQPYWTMGDSLHAFRQALADTREKSHSTAYVGRLDGVPVSYFERYWAAADPLSSHYDARDSDQGVHLLIGPEEFLGQGYGTALLRAMTDFAFRHAETERVVAEPDATNDAAINTFESVGFERVEEFYFPHEEKDAVLLVCDRERFESAYAPGALSATAAGSADGVENADTDDHGHVVEGSQ